MAGGFKKKSKTKPEIVVTTNKATKSQAVRTSDGRWKKGYSGNLPGWQSRTVEVRKLAKEYTQEAIDTLAEIMLNQRSSGADRIKAAQVLLDRAWGKPAANLQVTGANEGPIKIENAKQKLKDIIDAVVDRSAENGVAGKSN